MLTEALTQFVLLSKTHTFTYCATIGRPGGLPSISRFRPFGDTVREVVFNRALDAMRLMAIAVSATVVSICTGDVFAAGFGLGM